MLKKLNKRTNLILLVLIIFIIWMLFFDENSFLTHRELNKEIEKVQKTNTYFKNEIKKDQKTIKDLQNTDSLEKFGREHYLMKKKNEEIFIIETDSIQ